MLNRHERRAWKKVEQRAKLTHKMEPQTCVLWIPEACGYVQRFSAEGFAVIDEAQRAQRFCEEAAPSAALTMRDLFGVRVAVRPLYLHGMH